MSQAERDLTEALESGEAPASVEPETAALLSASFGATEARLAPVRERVLSRLDGLTAPVGRRPERPRPLPLLGRHRRLLLVGYASAAALLLTAYAGYWGVMRVQSRSLAIETRIGVKNLAIALRALKAGSQEPPSLDAALARLGLRADPYGNAFACDAGRVYSYGPNGRDDRGAQDDVVAIW